MINLDILKNKEIKIIGHPKEDFDSIVSGILLEYVLNKLGINANFVLQDNYIDADYLQIAKKIGFEYDFKRGAKHDDVLFLVDHTNFYDNEVVGCFDHHPTICKIDVNYVNKEKTCCAKIIQEWAIEMKVELTKELEILVMYACYLDSLSFKSTKAVEEDKTWCLNIIKKYNLDENEIITMGYGLTDKNIPVWDYFKNGFKSYPIGEKYISSSYIVVDNEEYDLKKAIEIFSGELSDEVIAWCFIVNNVKYNSTTILIVTKEYYLEEKVNNKILSRGKNIIPSLMDFLSFDNNGEITKLLIEKKIQVATMESCTSGLIASNITDYEGASAILKGSSITYSNEAKIKAGVHPSVINIYGVYSADTAFNMAHNTKKNFKADIGIGITGSFGNADPNNKDSIAGTIYFNILSKISRNSIKLVYNNINISRKEMKQKTVDIVLATLYSIVKKM